MSFFFLSFFFFLFFFFFFFFLNPTHLVDIADGQRRNHGQRIYPKGRGHVGALALGSGESELAAVVRAATEVMGLRSILNDFCLCGHVAIESDATAAIGMVHRLRLGKVQHLAVGDLWVQHHVR